MTKFITLISLLIVSTVSMAGTNVRSGAANGTTIVVKGMSLNIKNLKQGNGTVEVDGREVAKFEMRDAVVSLVWKTIKITNNQGDILDAKVTSMTNYTATITRFYSPGYGIDLRNFPVKCN